MDISLGVTSRRADSRKILHGVQKWKLRGLLEVFNPSIGSGLTYRPEALFQLSIFRTFSILEVEGFPFSHIRGPSHPTFCILWTLLGPLTSLDVIDMVPI